MPSKLLECIICPSNPSFSDVSHLLTHVGSKAHLSHLHKANIRSHQNIAAAHKLASYNQWSQEHEIEVLLSERLVQKEAKEVSQSHVSDHRPKIVKNEEELFSDSSLKFSLQNDAGVENSAGSISRHETCRVGRYPNHDHTVCTPTRNPSCSRPQFFASSPCRPWIPESEDEFLPAIDPRLKISPGSPKLKGKRWPGMNLFDAADEETRRKRNQRKDISVLKRIEYASTVVQPYETVHSANGNILKERHMDELETDSLVEGESPLMKPSPKRKARGSAKTSSGVRKKKKTNIQKQRCLPRRKGHGANSSTISTTIVDQTYTPKLEEIPDIIRTAEDVSDRKIKNDFAVDENRYDGSDENVSSSSLPNPFLDSTDGISSFAMAQLEFNTPSWLRPQNQIPQQSNPLKACQSVQLPTSTSDHREPHKSSIPLIAGTSSSQDQGITDALFCGSHLQSTPIPTFATMSDFWASPLSFFHTSFVGQLEDSHLSASNPLTEATAGFGPRTSPRRQGHEGTCSTL